MKTMNATIATPMDQAVEELITQLERKGQSPEQMQQTLQYVQTELRKIMPSGNWNDKTSREMIVKEVDRVKKMQTDNITNDPKARFRTALQTAKSNHTKAQ